MAAPRVSGRPPRIRLTGMRFFRARIPHPGGYALADFTPAVFKLATLAVAVLSLSGCTRSYYVRDLRSEYAAPEIPSQFGREKPGFRLTGYAAYARQKEVRFSEDTGYWVGEMWDEPVHHSLHGEVAIARLPSLAGLSAAYFGGPFVAGVAIAVPLEDSELGQGGTFFGLTPHFGAWTPMLTVGYFLNRVRTRLDYLSVFEDGLSSSRDAMEDTLAGVFWDPSVPLKAGLQYRAGPAAIYLIAGRSAAGVWPLPRGSGNRFTAKTWDASLGAEVSLPLGIGCALEAGREWTEVSDRYAEEHWKGRAFLTLDLPLRGSGP